MPNQTPLNPDALEAAAKALWQWWNPELPWDENDDRTIEQWRDEMAKVALSAYLAVAQPEVTSVEELDALPDGAYVQGYDGYKHAKNDEGTWNIVVNHRATPHGSDSIELPARVLYRPEVNDGRE